MTEIVVVIGGLALIAFWLAVLTRWRWGFIGLLVFLPFAGVIALRLHSTKEALLLKDFLFVLPAYASFFFFHRRDMRRVVVPKPDWETLVHLAFDEIRHYGRGSIR